MKTWAEVCKDNVISSIPPNKEEQLVFDILHMLNNENICPDTFAYRQETRGIPKYLGRKPGCWCKRWKVEKNPLEEGKPDIGGCKNGKSFLFEVKMPKGRIEPHQRAWMEEYVRKGKGVGYFVRSLQDAYEAWGEV